MPMKSIPFKKSNLASLGVELEFQLIDPHSYGLAARAKDLIRSITDEKFQAVIRPEITQTMIEINSSVHTSAHALLAEFNEIKNYLIQQGNALGIRYSGGGTHPFQKWMNQKIFPNSRFKNLSRQYRYLMKRLTVFGQHIHVGCPSADEAIYLTHALARYAPQLIAMSASSPFYQRIDTGFHSSRSNIFSSFPLSGYIPYLKDWREFSSYYHKMRTHGIVSSMKDFYWDIRPKPEFGTVEIRVCDTPLSIKKAVTIGAYAQALSAYLLQERPFTLNHDLYNLYNYNRFQAIRYGYEGIIVDPVTFQHISIADDIKKTIDIIQPYIDKYNNEEFILAITNEINTKTDDASRLRAIYKNVDASLPKMVKEQCIIWEKTS